MLFLKLPGIKSNQVLHCLRLSVSNLDLSFKDRPTTYKFCFEYSLIYNGSMFSLSIRLSIEYNIFLNVGICLLTRYTEEKFIFKTAFH